MTLLPRPWHSPSMAGRTCSPRLALALAVPCQEASSSSWWYTSFWSLLTGPLCRVAYPHPCPNPPALHPALVSSVALTEHLLPEATRSSHSLHRDKPPANWVHYNPCSSWSHSALSVPPPTSPSHPGYIPLLLRCSNRLL